MDATIVEFESKLGVQPIFGGYHKTQGTKNALINLNDGCYLEILAADDTNTSIKPLKWMGVDVLTKNQNTRFALQSNSLEKDSTALKHYNPNMGVITSGSRNTNDGSILQWELIMPLATPEVDIVPFMINWSGSESHPSANLPDMKCTLIELYATHPKPFRFKRLYESLDCDIKIKKSNIISLKAVLDTPNGSIQL